MKHKGATARLTFTRTPEGTPNLKLSADSFLAVALQPAVHGCRNKHDVERNVDNVCRLIDDTIFNPAGLGQVKLLAIPEGSLQGFWDEQSGMKQADYCENVAIRIPGPEIDRLCEKAGRYGFYLVAQAKIHEPEIMPGRYFNTAFIISPDGEIVLRHVKNILHVCEGTTSPYDVWDKWSEVVGTTLADHYPVLKTNFGNIGVAICYESVFPETYRALTAMGAEILIKMAIPSPLVMDGTWEATNIATAFYNSAYVIAPNFGPYYTTPDAVHPYDCAGGNSMIVDFLGRIVRRTHSANAGYVPAEIDIKKLREWRASGMSFLVQVRSGLWREIYEKWPDYPRNLYLERPIDSVAERAAVKRDLVGQYVEAGIIAKP